MPLPNCDASWRSRQLQPTRIAGRIWGRISYETRALCFLKLSAVAFAQHAVLSVRSVNHAQDAER